MNDVGIFVDCAAAYIEKRSGNVTVGELALHYGYSTSQLRRLFVKRMGISPREYISRCKMENARKLLTEEPARSVEEIAGMLGMYNAAHFCRQFKRREGCSPGEYRISAKQRG